MFLRACSPMSSNARSSLPAVSSCTRADTQMPPGSAKPSSRAATFTPSPKNVAILNNDIALVNADPNFDAFLGGDLGITLSHGVLNLSRTPHGIYNTGELNQETVPGGFDDAPSIFASL